jgi:fatty acid desaturase
MTPEFEHALRARVRADLPPAIFERQPWRVLLAFPLIATIAGLSALVIVLPVPWYGVLAAAIVLGNLYVALMFFGHEAIHGAMVRSERLQDLLGFFTLAIYLVSPHLWRHWHNRMHHAHTNIEGVDPDRYARVDDVLDRRDAATWLTVRFAPGSGHWLSALYLWVAFTTHGQSVLWSHSLRYRFPSFRWCRAVLETAGVVAFWISLAVWLGPASALAVVLLPMLVANAVIMAYVTTNHMLRPSAEQPVNLVTSMSVRTHRLLDMAHLHFSHHIEHHLYPSLSHRYYPLVRASLSRHAPEQYLAPSHWRALAVLYRTPRYYEGDRCFVNPLTGRRTAIAEVEARLRAAR